MGRYGTLRLTRVSRWPCVPWWAVAVVAVHCGMVGAYVWLSRGLGDSAPPLCLFRRLTGYPCPTCGSTRLTLAALHGDFGAAFWLNPLVFVTLAGCLAWLTLRLITGRQMAWTLTPGVRRAVLLVVVLAVLANWLYLLSGV